MKERRIIYNGSLKDRLSTSEVNKMSANPFGKK